MPTNFPGPYEIEINYESGGLTHKHRISCDVQTAPTVGDDPTVITLETKDSAGITLSAAVAAWINLIKPRYKTTATFLSYDFWKYTVGTFSRTWISTGILGIAGTSTGDTVLAQQSTFTFRTLEGNIMRHVLLESIDNTNSVVPYASAPATVQALMDYTVASNTWMLARDTSYPIAQLNAVGGQNETIFKKRYR